MNNDQLGRLARGDERRDAVHIAITPCEASEALKPGQHVGVDAMGRLSARTEHKIGIVDPFLRRDVEEGQRCFLCLYPNTITSLRHEWVHPAISAQEPMDDLRIVAERVANLCGKTYQALMDDASDFHYSVEHSPHFPDWIMDNSERYKDVPGDDWEKFWQHWERVTGKKQNACERYSPYTCSC